MATMVMRPMSTASSSDDNGAFFDDMAYLDAVVDEPKKKTKPKLKWGKKDKAPKTPTKKDVSPPVPQKESVSSSVSMATLSKASQTKAAPPPLTTMPAAARTSPRKPLPGFPSVSSLESLKQSISNPSLISIPSISSPKRTVNASPAPSSVASSSIAPASIAASIARSPSPPQMLSSINSESDSDAGPSYFDDLAALETTVDDVPSKPKIKKSKSKSKHQKKNSSGGVGLSRLKFLKSSPSLSKSSSLDLALSTRTSRSSDASSITMTHIRSRSTARTESSQSNYTVTSTTYSAMLSHGSITQPTSEASSLYRQSTAASSSSVKSMQTAFGPVVPTAPFHAESPNSSPTSGTLVSSGTPKAMPFPPVETLASLTSNPLLSAAPTPASQKKTASPVPPARPRRPSATNLTFGAVSPPSAWHGHNVTYPDPSHKRSSSVDAGGSRTSPVPPRRTLRSSSAGTPGFLGIPDVDPSRRSSSTSQCMSLIDSFPAPPEALEEETIDFMQLGLTGPLSSIGLSGGHLKLPPGVAQAIEEGDRESSAAFLDEYMRFVSNPSPPRFDSLRMTAAPEPRPTMERGASLTRRPSLMRAPTITGAPTGHEHSEAEIEEGSEEQHANDSDNAPFKSDDTAASASPTIKTPDTAGRTGPILLPSPMTSAVAMRRSASKQSSKYDEREAARPESVMLPDEPEDHEPAPPLPGMPDMSQFADAEEYGMERKGATEPLRIGDKRDSMQALDRNVVIPSVPMTKAEKRKSEPLSPTTSSLLQPPPAMERSHSAPGEDRNNGSSASPQRRVNRKAPPALSPDLIATLERQGNPYGSARQMPMSNSVIAMLAPNGPSRSMADRRQPPPSMAPDFAASLEPKAESSSAKTVGERRQTFGAAPSLPGMPLVWEKSPRRSRMNSTTSTASGHESHSSHPSPRYATFSPVSGNYPPMPNHLPRLERAPSSPTVSQLTAAGGRQRTLSASERSTDAAGGTLPLRKRTMSSTTAASAAAATSPRQRTASGNMGASPRYRTTSFGKVPKSTLPPPTLSVPPPPPRPRRRSAANRKASMGPRAVGAGVDASSSSNAETTSSAAPSAASSPHRTPPTSPAAAPAMPNTFQPSYPVPPVPSLPPSLSAAAPRVRPCISTAQRSRGIPF